MLEQVIEQLKKNNAIHILFMGPPGVGKGTYAAIFQELLGIPHISTGEILRQESAKDTERGKYIKNLIDSGNYVPDDTMNPLLIENLKKNTSGFILDGYPRTISQAIHLENEGIRIDKALYFHASVETIIERLAGRKTCSDKSCQKTYNVATMKPKIEGICDICTSPLSIREDDHPDSIRKRLRVYEEKTAPLIPFYQDRGLLQTVNANTNIHTDKSILLKDISYALSSE